MSIAQLRRAAIPALIVALAAFATAPASAAPTDKDGKSHAAKSAKSKKHKAVHTQPAPAAQAPAMAPRANEFPPDKYNPSSGY